ncbi:hypothetical protein EXIGLDRAFT_723271 [Exidia glandulosa HHB12029]|uniref:Uncharacterized protein n=1 Tax=Exidia glandulosa HHB12029 TaxID=1314781 RepID=A0A165EWG8_EXIGL|nr:hypothetical protein EXIGLDRAFT_723271 [Exidia glandulosa HHB12029]
MNLVKDKTDATSVLRAFALCRAADEKGALVKALATLATQYTDPAKIVEVILLEARKLVQLAMGSGRENVQLATANLQALAQPGVVILQPAPKSRSFATLKVEDSIDDATPTPTRTSFSLSSRSTGNPARPRASSDSAPLLNPAPNTNDVTRSPESDSMLRESLGTARVQVRLLQEQLDKAQTAHRSARSEVQRIRAVLMKAQGEGQTLRSENEQYLLAMERKDDKLEECMDRIDALTTERDALLADKKALIADKTAREEAKTTLLAEMNVLEERQEAFATLVEQLRETLDDKQHDFNVLQYQQAQDVQTMCRLRQERNRVEEELRAEKKASQTLQSETNIRVLDLQRINAELSRVNAELRRALVQAVQEPTMPPPYLAQSPPRGRLRQVSAKWCGSPEDCPPVAVFAKVYGDHLSADSEDPLAAAQGQIALLTSKLGAARQVITGLEHAKASLTAKTGAAYAQLSVARDEVKAGESELVAVLAVLFAERAQKCAFEKAARERGEHARASEEALELLKSEVMENQLALVEASRMIGDKDYQVATLENDMRKLQVALDASALQLARAHAALAYKAGPRGGELAAPLTTAPARHEQVPFEEEAVDALGFHDVLAAAVALQHSVHQLFVF